VSWLVAIKCDSSGSDVGKCLHIKEIAGSDCSASAAVGGAGVARKCLENGQAVF